MLRTDGLRARLLSPATPTDRLWGWVGPLLIAAIGGFLRFWQLGRPDSLVFDETYYVKQGWSLVRHGVELRTKDGLDTPDELWNAGNLDVYGTAGDMVVHPPTGKWLIGLGELLFGATSPVGWRFSVAVVGTLSILVIARVARRMFGSTALGCLAGTLLAFEGLHFTMSRTAILDIFVSFFALVAFAALVLDRYRTREILIKHVERAAPGGSMTGGSMTWGPWLGTRPWRWVAGVALGLCVSTKWSGIFFIAAFGLMTFAWDASARRAVGVAPWRQSLLNDGPFAFVQLVLTAAVVYVVSWTGWFATEDGYHRQWNTFNPGEGILWLPPVLRNWVQYHRDMWGFNTTLETPHDYASDAWTWILQIRPTSMFYAGTEDLASCGADACSQAVNPIGTLSIWWAGLIALVICLWWWLRRRDWRAGAIWVGLIAGYLPWFIWYKRTIFQFYAVAFEPYVVLALVFVGWMLVGRTGLLRRQRQVGWAIIAVFVVLTVMLFAYFYPVYAAQIVPYSQWNARMWFSSWI